MLFADDLEGHDFTFNWYVLIPAAGLLAVILTGVAIAVVKDFKGRHRRDD